MIDSLSDDLLSHIPFPAKECGSISATWNSPDSFSSLKDIKSNYYLPYMPDCKLRSEK